MRTLGSAPSTASPTRSATVEPRGPSISMVAPDAFAVGVSLAASLLKPLKSLAASLFGFLAVEVAAAPPKAETLRLLDAAVVAALGEASATGLLEVTG